MLTEILRELIEKVKQGEPVQRELKHGLHILMRPKEGGVLLTIWRYNAKPSVPEWNTVIAFWPQPLGAINWDEDGTTESGRHYKQAFIAL